MKLRKEWKNWQVFLVSVILALIVTFLVAPFYSNIFSYPRGGFFINDELLDNLEIHLYSFLFLYTFFLSFFYIGFRKMFTPSAFVYLLVLPILFFMLNFQTFAGGIVVVGVGIILGRLVKNFKSEK